MVHGAMKNQRIVAILDKLLEEEVSLRLLINEYEYTSFIIPHSKNLQQPEKLGCFFSDFNNLFDIHTGLPSAPNNNFDWLFKNSFRKIFHILWKGR